MKKKAVQATAIQVRIKEIDEGVRLAEEHLPGTVKEFRNLEAGKGWHLQEDRICHQECF